MEADYALEARRSSWRCAWQRVVRCLCCCFPLPLGSLSLRGGTAATGHPQPLLDEAGSGRRRAGGRTRGQHRSASARHHNRDDRSGSALLSLLPDGSASSSSERSPSKPTSSGGGGRLLTPLPTPLLPPPRSPSPDDTDKLSGAQAEGKCKHLRSQSLLVGLDDDECCPTCLEEYTADNPKIMTECKHHYHLGCIYEWMERSDRCPVCSKQMVFHEDL